MQPTLKRIHIDHGPRDAHSPRIRLDFSNDRHHVSGALEGTNEDIALQLILLAKRLLRDTHLLNANDSNQ
jgi:hypothetical protein